MSAAAPPSPGVSGASRASDGHEPSAALRPLGLGFVDRALEVAYWAHFARERASYVRVTVGILMACAVGFVAVDVLAFGPLWRQLVVARGVMVTLMALPLPWVYGRRSERALAAHAQEILLYLAIVPVLSLSWMQHMVARAADDLRVTLTLVPALFVLVCIYCLSSIRFLYAAPLGLLGTAAYGVLLGPRLLAQRDLGLTAVAFLGGQTLVGLTVCWMLESSGRREFLRRRELVRAHERTEALLCNLMPEALANRLKDAPGAALSRVPKATVMFATLVGFDRATEGMAAIDAVRFLDRIVARFDILAATRGVERIKTIGPSYMAAAGVVDASPAGDRRDADAVAALALELRDVVRALATERGLALSLRVGIATGPLVAGVLGQTRMAFDCWGDTANLASRLDSHGEPDRIQVCEATIAALDGAFVTEPRGPVRIKGKGEVRTSWLVGARGGEP